MKDKLICFMILILFAVTFFVMAKETTTIVCNNVDRTCHLLKENSLLKTKRVLNYTKIGDKYTRKNRGTSFSLTNDGKKTTYSYSKNNINYLACYKKEKNTINRSGTKTYRTSYLLVPIREVLRNSVQEQDALNRYVSHSFCETDRQVLEKYLNSNDKDIFKHKTTASYINFLFYLGTAFFVIIAFLMLFFGKATSDEELNANQELTHEEQMALHQKARDFVNFVKDFDSNMAENIENTGSKIRKFKIE